MQFYSLAEHTPPYDVEHLPNANHDRVQAYGGLSMFLGRRGEFSSGECLHKSVDTCTPDAHICHYITPAVMYDLHQKQQQAKQ